MDAKNFVGLLVFGVIGVIVLSAFVPIISETTSATKTFENDGYYRMSSITAEDTTTYVVEWDKTTPNVITLNNVPIELNLTSAPSEVSIMFDGDWIFRANLSNGAINSVSYITSQGGGTNIYDKFNCTLVQGSMTVIIDENTTKTNDYDTAYIPNSNGQFIMKKTDGVAYINENSELVGFGLSTIRYAPSGFGQRGISFDGSLENGITPVIWRPPSDTTTTVGDVVINAPSVNGYLDLYALSNVTMVTTHTEDDATAQTDLTYSYFLVPYEVTAEKSVHPDETLSAVIDLLPLIAGIGLMIILVAEFLYTRYL